MEVVDDGENRMRAQSFTSLRGWNPLLICFPPNRNVIILSSHALKYLREIYLNWEVLIQTTQFHIDLWHPAHEGRIPIDRECSL